MLRYFNIKRFIQDAFPLFIGGFKPLARLLYLGILSISIWGMSGCTSHDFGHSIGTEKISFNQRWTFHKGQLDSTQVFVNGQLPLNGLIDTARWYNIMLPHDWSIFGKFSKENLDKNGGHALPTGIGWYRKTFNLPTSDRYKHIFIEFEGAYRNSTVWINGHRLGSQRAGDVGFTYDLSKYLHFDDRSNVLVVSVDNRQQPAADWYTGSGINRNVWLIKKMPITIDAVESYYAARIQMPHRNDSVPSNRMEEAVAVVNQDVVIDNMGMPAIEHEEDKYEKKQLESQQQRLGLRIQIKTTIYDANNFQVAQKTGSVKPTRGRQHIKWQLKLRDIKPWSPDVPYLYTWEVELRQGAHVIDRIRQPLGFRDIRFDSLKGLYLNGIQTPIKGVCLAADWGPLGTAYNYSAMTRQLKILKDMGCNAIRTVHQPPAPEVLSLCDSMGFLVMDEAFDNWNDLAASVYKDSMATWIHQKQLGDLIKRDRCHPSVFIWSLGNTGQLDKDTLGLRMATGMRQIIRGLDSTRLITAAMNQIEPKQNRLARSGILDVLGFNYNSAFYDSLPHFYPGKSFIATEVAGALETRGAYTARIPDSAIYLPGSAKDRFADTTGTNWAVSAYDLYAARWGTTHEAALLSVKNRDFIAGSFVWTGFDYMGGHLPYPFPARSAYSGIVDMAGLHKDVYFMYQSEWAAKPVLHVFPEWNWNEGDTIHVWAYYSQADSVELLLNGQSLGKRCKGDGKPGDSPLHVSWQVPYKAGKLEVVTKKGGQTVLTQEVKTAGAATKLAASVDQAFFRGIIGDLIFVTVRLTDENGVLVTGDDREIEFSIKGPAALVGLSNGYQAGSRSLKGHTLRTWKGKVVAFIEPKVNKGHIELDMQAAGMEEQREGILVGE